MESEEAFELALPALGFEDTVCTIPGVLGVSPTSVWGEEEVGRQVATPSRAQHTVLPQDVTPVALAGLSGGVPGQAASGCSSPAEVGDSGQVAPVSSSSLGGGPGQEDSDASSPVVSSSRMVPVSPSGVGSGQAASEPSPMVVPSPVQVGEPGREVLAMSLQPSVMPSSGGAR